MVIPDPSPLRPLIGHQQDETRTQATTTGSVRIKEKSAPVETLTLQEKASSRQTLKPSDQTSGPLLTLTLNSIFLLARQMHLVNNQKFHATLNWRPFTRPIEIVGRFPLCKPHCLPNDPKIGSVSSRKMVWIGTVDSPSSP